MGDLAERTVKIVVDVDSRASAEIEVEKTKKVCTAHLDIGFKEAIDEGREGIEMEVRVRLGEHVFGLPEGTVPTEEKRGFGL